MPVQMELQKIIISDLQNLFVIVLKEVDGERSLPIVIGENEAHAIDRRIKGIPTSRPLTHDLLASVIEQLGGTVERIEITKLVDSTYFGQIVIRQGDRLINIDSRPSDAIALGSTTLVPIFVAEQVLEQASQANQ